MSSWGPKAKNLTDSSGVVVQLSQLLTPSIPLARHSLQ